MLKEIRAVSCLLLYACRELLSCLLGSGELVLSVRLYAILLPISDIRPRQTEGTPIGSKCPVFPSSISNQNLLGPKLAWHH
jgi:hypothetical protein